MSDLSWLNPTPHAIAVYASRPLSPVATQHSLPSGRYPLLGPDFHRLDRTSLRLAHSLDHLVGEREQPWWDRQLERPGRFQIDEKLEPGRQFDRQVAGLSAPEDATHIHTGAAIGRCEARPITHQPAIVDELPERIHHRYPVACRKVHELCAPRHKERIAADHERAHPLLSCGSKRRVDFFDGAHLDNDRRPPSVPGRNHDLLYLGVCIWRFLAHEKPNITHARIKIVEQV